MTKNIKKLLKEKGKLHKQYNKSGRKDGDHEKFDYQHNNRNFQ